MNIYTNLIIDLYKNPLNKRELKNAKITHSGTNVMCGDRVRMYAKINGEGVIEDCSFEGEGCAITIASASLLTEEAKGKLLSDVLQWGTLNVFEWLSTELGPSRVKCGMLPLETLQEGIKRTNAAKIQTFKPYAKNN